MSGMKFSDEMLMAYADGELLPAIAAEIDAQLEHDDNLARRVAMFTETRDLTKRAFATMTAEPVPERLTQAVQGLVSAAQPEREVPGPRRYRRFAAANSNVPPRMVFQAAAAVLLAVVAAAGGFWLGGMGPAGDAMIGVAAVTPADIGRHLSETPSGGRHALSRSGASLEIISTFEVAGNICREFELDPSEGRASVAVACFTEGSWKTTFAVVTAERGSGFVPASSMDAVEAYLDSISAGQALSAEKEAEALSGLR